MSRTQTARLSPGKHRLLYSTCVGLQADIFLRTTAIQRAHVNRRAPQWYRSGQVCSLL